MKFWKSLEVNQRYLFIILPLILLLFSYTIFGTILPRLNENLQNTDKKELIFKEAKFVKEKVRRKASYKYETVFRIFATNGENWAIPSHQSQCYESLQNEDLKGKKITVYVSPSTTKGHSPYQIVIDGKEYIDKSKDRNWMIGFVVFYILYTIFTFIVLLRIYIKYSRKKAVKSNLY